MSELVSIDGSMGGGQILRSALSLSMITGRPFAIERIRAGRSRPGLMRQHLTAVKAAAEVCGARLRGDELGSTQLEFRPGPVRAGRYRFAISSAGSSCLVLQTVLPALMVAGQPSTLAFAGGTHNPLAPPYPFLDQVFLPVLERMDVKVGRVLTRPGFHPGGGGSFDVDVTPVTKLAPLDLSTRGALRSVRAEAHVANLPHHVGMRELAVVKERLGFSDDELHLRTPDADGPGNVLLLSLVYEHVTEMVVGFGERNLRAELVAERACAELLRYRESTAPVGEHLADQLLLPLAMAGRGSFRTLPLSDHARSSMQLIRQFLAVDFIVQEALDGTVQVGIQDT